MGLLTWLQRRLHGASVSTHGVEGPTWPPKELEKRKAVLDAYRMRFENDEAKLIQHTPYLSSSPERQKTFTPVPFAREVARYSASLLFSEQPAIRFPAKPAEVEEDEETPEDPREDLLERVLRANALEPFLQETGEKIASEGRGALRIVRDETVSDEPLITFVPDDRVLWDTRHGRFVRGGAVFFEYETGDHGQSVYRLFENHEPGRISRALFKGAKNTLGNEVDLYTRFASETGPYVGRGPEDAVAVNEERIYALSDLEGLEREEETGLDKPTLVRWDNVPGGHSDIKGLSVLQDRINEAVSGGVDKERKSRPLTFADPSLADGAGAVDLSGVIFSRSGEANIARAMGEEPKQYAEVVQPEFRQSEQTDWFWFLWEVSVMHAGYSPSSWAKGADGGTAESGRALRIKLTKTLTTRSGKERMAKEAIRTALAAALAWADGNGSPRKIADFRPEIELGDGLPVDPAEDAAEAVQWRAAEGISTEDVVRMRRPDLDDDAVREEAARIKEEEPAQPSVPTTSRLPDVTLPED